MRTLYLIGMMGCGKSTCAGILGGRLGLPVLDTDGEIERKEGRTVSEIFAAQGEDTFRELETALLRTLASREDLVVSCGGGLPLRAENRTLLRAGITVFLNRDPEKIYETADMSGRPLGQAGKAAFLERFRQREPLYLEAADIVIGDCGTPEETVEEILKQLESRGALIR